MQEIVLILSSLVGIATAAAVRKMPKSQLHNFRANSHIKNQINSLRIEKDLLGKTISRLYQDDIKYTSIQREQLLSKYQHQMGVILAKLEKLEYTSKHPDFGPVGDGLLTLMDQKLSKLDDRLHELSSKMTFVTTNKDDKPNQTKNELTKDVQSEQTVSKKLETVKMGPIKPPEPSQLVPDNMKKQSQEPVHAKPKKTVIHSKKPDVTKPKDTLPKDLEVKPKSVETKPKDTPSKDFETKPKSVNTNNKQDDDFEDDSDDINKIKGDIERILNKLNQAEVE